MSYQYDLAPGMLIESLTPLSVDDVEQAKERLRGRVSQKALVEVAESVGPNVRAVEPKERPPVGIMLKPEEYAAFRQILHERGIST